MYWLPQCLINPPPSKAELSMVKLSTLPSHTTFYAVNSGVAEPNLTNFYTVYRNDQQLTWWNANCAIQIHLIEFWFKKSKWQYFSTLCRNLVRLSNCCDYNVNNCIFCDNTAKVDISHEISQNLLDQSSPIFSTSRHMGENYWSDICFMEAERLMLECENCATTPLKFDDHRLFGTLALLNGFE